MGRILPAAISFLTDASKLVNIEFMLLFKCFAINRSASLLSSFITKRGKAAFFNNMFMYPSIIMSIFSSRGSSIVKMEWILETIRFNAILKIASKKVSSLVSFCSIKLPKHLLKASNPVANGSGFVPTGSPPGTSLKS